MSSPAWTFVIAAVIAALADWRAVLRQDLRAERIAKPAVIVALLVAVATMDDGVGSARPWVLVALVASLAGDLLLLPGGRFRIGLAAFLVAQIAYLVSFLARPLDALGAVIGIVAAAVLIAVAGRRIAIAAGLVERSTGIAVVAYLGAISAMAIVATATFEPLVIAGAWLFVLSDALLGWTRFVGDIGPIAAGTPIARLAVMVPYHAAQVLLVLALALA